MKPLTTDFVEAYFDHMLGHFDATLMPIGRIEEALDFVPGYDEFKTIYDALTMMGITDTVAFIDRASVTVGRFICLPYEPGVVADENYSLDRQCRNLGHELTHVLQYREDPLFLVNYLTSRSKRAKSEVDALKVELEISFHRHGKVPYIHHMVQNLKRNYLIRTADAVVSEKHLEAYAGPVSQGDGASVVGKACISFMRQHGY